ncbi:peptidoglycan-binding protein [Streptomyces sp. NPDC087658]|uniref:peptidoglycan-binding protein n=1 Tax=Streptomyces sp. NPDC087658 TaxID=3365800 RepID=UPI0038261F40
MTVPVFEEYEPAPDCPCPGCAERRRDLARGLSVRAGGHPTAHGARRALVLVTAAGVALGATGAGVGGDPAWAAGASRPVVGVGTAVGRADPYDNPEPQSPQGGSAPLYGRPLPGPGAGRPTIELRPTTRAEIIGRAMLWVDAKVSYSMEKFWSDGYRQDCSGYVSMAWNLAGNEWTGSLDQYGVRIEREELQPGDMLLFHNPADPNKGSHVTLFGGWTDSTHTYYTAYEQTKPYTRTQATPMAYWNNSSRYVAYRYRGLTDDSGGKGPGAGTGTEAGASTAYPGAASFGPGAHNAHVTRLGRMLVERGGERFYARGPGPSWGESDRLATQAFQHAQGWRGAEADGLPGPETWRYLVNGLGRNIPGPGAARGAGGHGGTPRAIGAQAASRSAPVFPGGGFFRPGRSSAYVSQLGRQLVRKGFGRHYASGPGPVWTEADRRNVEAFQRAQGWRGAEADGYPGPQTWQRLFA